MNITVFVHTVITVTKYVNQGKFRHLKISSKFVISCLVTGSFPIVIANLLTAAFRYREQHGKPISDMRSIEYHVQSRSSPEAE